MPSRPCTTPRSPLYPWIADTTPADVLAHHKAFFGDARMSNDPPPADPPGDDGADPSNDPTGEPQTLDDVMADLGLTADQIKGRLEASKKWEQRAKSSDRVDRVDYDRVRNELDTLRRANESEQEKAVREAREQGAQEATQAASTAAARMLLKVALRTRGVADEDEISEAIEATNLSVFVNADGTVDDEKVIRQAARLTATASPDPNLDTGQGRRQRIVTKPGQGGRDEAERRFGNGDKK